MGPELIGVYAYVLDLIYARDGQSTRDDGALAGRLGCSKRKATTLIDQLIERGKIEFRDGFLTHKHAEEHANKRRARTEQASSAGRASGEKRRSVKENKELTEQTVRSSDEQSTEYRVQSTELEPKGSLSAFDHFWKIWPDKKNKSPAQKAWKKLNQDDRRQAYSAVRDGWFEKWRASQPDAAPIHAATFLNRRRWEDELPSNLAINGGSNGSSTSRSRQSDHSRRGGAHDTLFSAFDGAGRS